MPDYQDVTQWRVLIVDDDIDNLTLAAEYLKYVGASVKTAYNGVEGLAAAREYAPTIILCDLSMPIKDGWGMLEGLKKDAALASIPVIALTAHAMPQDRERVVAAGFEGYVTKPFMFRVLVEEMKRWLGRRDQGKGSAGEALISGSTPPAGQESVTAQSVPAAPISAQPDKTNSQV